MAVKKIRLNLAMEEDFCLLGLTSDVPDYKLAWLINRGLHMHFEKEEDLLLLHKKTGSEQRISHFSCSDADAWLTYRILNNRACVGHFLEEMKNLDYLIHIQGELDETKIRHFLQEINALPEVRFCVPVELGRIRDRERLFLW
ncbi:MAG: IPExxxVDY family protein [Bacteroidales bacterium]